MEKGSTNLLILDEINVAIAYGLLSVEEALKLLQRKTPPLKIILTGRRTHPLITECADLVNEVRKLKHPAEKGVRARKGIEY